MNAPLIRRPAQAVGPEQGFVLATGLLFLVIVTLLGLALFRSSGLMERVSANTRDKQRAFESAQAALQYGEWFLGSSTAPVKKACNTTTGKTVTSATEPLHVCSESLPASRDTLAALAWQPNAFAYTPGTMAVQLGGGLTAAGTDINYQAPPGVYIEDLGLMTGSSNTELYQVTAYGYGGNADTSSIVRSTYKVTSPVKDLSSQP
jgi:type IV pilus assembly protein PilX